MEFCDFDVSAAREYICISMYLYFLPHFYFAKKRLFEKIVLCRA